MALASAYGLQYELPQDVAMSQRGGSPIRGGLGEGQDPIDFGQGDLLSDDLYVKEQATEEYFQKVIALKSFANEVSSKYGYDVTRPNYRDRESIKFHQAYLESLADLKNTQNQLKRLASQEDVSLKDANIVRGEDEKGNDYFSNVGENDMVKSLRQTAAQIKSPEQAESFAIVLDDLYQETIKEANESRDPRERKELQATAKMIKGITTDTGLTKYQDESLDLQRQRLAQDKDYKDKSLKIQAARANKASAGSKPTQGEKDAVGRLQTLADVAQTGQMENVGITVSKTATGTYLETTDTSGKVMRMKVDPKDPKSFLMKLNGFMNKDASTTSVGYDRLQGLGVDLEGFSNTIMQSIGGNSPDISKGFLEGLDSIMKASNSNPELQTALIDVIQSGGIVPSSVAKDFEGGSASQAEILNIKVNEGGFFSNKGIDITIKGAGGKEKTTKLSMDNEADRAKIKKIIEFNIDYIPYDKIMQLAPQREETPMTQESGTNNAVNTEISMDDF